jgi:hypothetical protein
MVGCAGTATNMEPDEKPDPTSIDVNAPARGVLFPDEQAHEPNEPG